MKPMLFRLSLLIMLLFTAPAQAQDISRHQAIKIAQKSHPGRILAVKRSGHYYRIKVLSTGGEVRVILVNASSGKVSRKQH
ncbi:hypothetical protein MNBD_GAMMA11-988 [hydrothermal vent metagenome]|uniref:PepSY domain-containing protein n=1 Tax=hydrothermal vent metagenome TaxID=652676 RepID=A0A3B0X8R0_9ZZZZ